MSELTYTVPEGYEIDIEKSDFKGGKIMIKESNPKRILKWEDIVEIFGFFISEYDSTVKPIFTVRKRDDEWDKKLFSTKEYAEAALAFAQLSQVYQHYDKCDYDGKSYGYVIHIFDNKLNIELWSRYGGFFRFKTYSEAQLFIDNNRELLEKFYMI